MKGFLFIPSIISGHLLILPLKVKMVPEESIPDVGACTQLITTWTYKISRTPLASLVLILFVLVVIIIFLCHLSMGEPSHLAQRCSVKMLLAEKVTFDLEAE